MVLVSVNWLTVNNEVQMFFFGYIYVGPRLTVENLKSEVDLVVCKISRNE